jgi:hypothetical protein
MGLVGHIAVSYRCGFVSPLSREAVSYRRSPVKSKSPNGFRPLGLFS